MNLPYDWIALTVFGHYDSIKNNYLILSTIGPMIQFLTKYTILFPSSAIRYKSTPYSRGRN